MLAGNWTGVAHPGVLERRGIVRRRDLRQGVGLDLRQVAHSRRVYVTLRVR